jgi:hypothetical protein
MEFPTNLTAKEKIHMNMNNNPTKEELQALLRACDDTAGGHILWVSRSGEVQIILLTRETAAKWAGRMGNEIQFRYETYGSGNDYVGENAANDDRYVSSLFKKLLTDWQEDKRGYIDI